MRQPHRNLFYSYRGAAPSIRDRDFVFERQLEDNATKALINVLEHCERTRVLVPFLRTITKVVAKGDSEAVQFALQRVDVDRPQAKKKIALVIAPICGLDDKKASAQVSGRPDAWIWDDNAFAVLVETKVVGQASSTQIKRHLSSANGWSNGGVTIQCVSWANVYEFFYATYQQANRLNPISRLLIGEFLEYLNMIGVTNRTVFDIEDFVFFALDKVNRSPMHKRIVAQKLERFTQQLADSSAVREIVKLYGKSALNAERYVNPGTFRDGSNNFWITIGPKERRNHCHLTVRITEHGVRLDAFAPHRHFTKKLLKAFRTDTDGFLAAVKHIPEREPFVIRLREAYYADPKSSYKGQRIDSWLDFVEVHPSFVTNENIHTVLIEPVAQRLKMKALRPEVFLVRNFALSELMGKSDAVEQVAAAAKKMVPYLRWALGVTS